MNKIDLIIHALESAHHTNDTGVMGLTKSRLDVALDAARELKALKPVAWAVERKVATCNEEFAELWRSNGEEVTSLYALDEVKHD